MPVRIWLRLTELAIVAALVAVIIIAWQADRRDRAQLAAQLSAAQQTIAQATSNQKDRDAQLTQTLAHLSAEKQSNLTIAQLLQALPQAFRLPAPIALQSAAAATDSNPRTTLVSEISARGAMERAPDMQTPPSKGNSLAKPTAGDPARPSAIVMIDNPLPKTSSLATAPNAVIPSTDLKPLYDFALDCQACQAKLSASQADLADEKTKSASLIKERDAALRVAKGGTALRRIARAAKWFVLGAAAGAIAAKATR